MEFSKRSLNIIKSFFLLLIYINIIVAGEENILLLIMLFSLSLGNDLFKKNGVKSLQSREALEWKRNCIYAIHNWYSCYIKIYD